MIARVVRSVDERPAGLRTKLVRRRFLFGVYPKNPLAGEVGVQGFSIPGGGFLLSMKTMGVVFPRALTGHRCRCCRTSPHVVPPQPVRRKQRGGTTNGAELGRGEEVDACGSKCGRDGEKGGDAKGG
jgi:hypothetical protein